jgi:hypothetical protein
MKVAKGASAGHLPRDERINLSGGNLLEQVKSRRPDAISVEFL